MPTTLRPFARTGRSRQVRPTRRRGVRRRAGAGRGRLVVGKTGAYGPLSAGTRVPEDLTGGAGAPRHANSRCGDRQRIVGQKPTIVGRVRGVSTQGSPAGPAGLSFRYSQEARMREARLSTPLGERQEECGISWLKGHETTGCALLRGLIFHSCS